MLTLYYAPGACSMASHIALEETGAPYQTQIVGLAQGEQTKPEYLNKVNPRGKVPALQTDDGMLTENDVEFRLYRKYSTETDIKYDITPDPLPEDKTKEAAPPAPAKKKQ